MREIYWGGKGKGVPKELEKREAGGKVSTPDDGNTVFFFKDVTQESVQVLVHSLHDSETRSLRAALEMSLLFRHEAGPPPIHLHIHSYGGDLFAGFAAAEAVRKSRVPVHTHVEGGAASAATIFSVMGVHRTIGENSFILIHQLSSGFWGKYEEWKDETKNNDLLMARLHAIYAERTRLPKKKVEEILKRDLWFDAKKALKCGLVDEIL